MTYDFLRSWRRRNGGPGLNSPLFRIPAGNGTGRRHRKTSMGPVAKHLRRSVPNKLNMKRPVSMGTEFGRASTRRRLLGRLHRFAKLHRLRCELWLGPPPNHQARASTDGMGTHRRFFATSQDWQSPRSPYCCIQGYGEGLPGGFISTTNAASPRRRRKEKGNLRWGNARGTSAEKVFSGGLDADYDTENQPGLMTAECLWRVSPQSTNVDNPGFGNWAAPEFRRNLRINETQNTRRVVHQEASCEATQLVPVAGRYAGRDSGCLSRIRVRDLPYDSSKEAPSRRDWRSCSLVRPPYLGDPRHL